MICDEVYPYHLVDAVFSWGKGRVHNNYFLFMHLF
uniref:Uncharacterized protein n=1 Tax=Heterorhabditis bacteriophora TaxID=37862 RepID=A0A1I7WJF7_HETBA